MSLFPCPECGREISDLATACPGCGAPVDGRLAEGSTDVGLSERVNRTGNLAVGDLVELSPTRPAPYRNGKVHMVWEREDDPLLGQIDRVTSLEPDGTFKLANDPRGGWFAPTWTVRVPAEQPAGGGTPAEAGDSRKVVLGLLISIFAVVVLLGVFAATRSSTEVTFAEYSQLANGMTQAQAVSIIGSPGVEVSSSNVEGMAGVIPDINTKGYMWQNRDGSNVVAVFQNDGLVMKAQAGLR